MRSRAAAPHTEARKRFPHARALWLACRSGRGAVGMAITMAVIALATIGPHVAPKSSTDLTTPPYASPSGSSWLGGDELGRDVVSRVLAGGWQLIWMTMFATALGVVAGAVAGTIAGYFAGWIDEVVMRLCDVVIAIPQLIFTLVVISIAGSSTWLLIGTVAFTTASHVARVLRSACLDVCERDFVKAAEATGHARIGIILYEVVPNLITPLLIEFSARLPGIAAIIASLSFLGFGLPPPTPNWGIMINENIGGLSLNPWAVVVPALLIAMFTVGESLYADALTKVLLRPGTQRYEPSRSTVGV